MDTTSIKLPDKPSALIRLALADLAKCEAANDLYQINMSDWHRQAMTGNLDPSGDWAKTCRVCFAGAVIAQTLDTDPEDDVDPNRFDDDTKSKLFALNDFRSYDFVPALEVFMDYDPAVKLRDELSDQHELIETTYNTDPDGFKADLNTVADFLEKRGW